MGESLFPVSLVENILYKCGEDEVFKEAGKLLYLVLKLKGTAVYVMGFGNDGQYYSAMVYKNKLYTVDEEIKTVLDEYNQWGLERENCQDLVHSIVCCADSNITIPEKGIREIIAKITDYIKSNPTDIDYLFFLAHEALQLYVIKNNDPFDLKYLIKIVVINDIEEEFLNYIGKKDDNQLDCLNKELYLSEIDEALKLFRKISKEAHY